jgi:hypothetical protein
MIAVSTVISVSTTVISTFCISPAEMFVFKPFVIKTSPVEITCMLSFEKRAVVLIVEMVAEVAIPCRVVIISISGELIFVYYGWCIFILIDRGRSIFILVDRRFILVNDRGRRSDIYPGGREPETDACIYIYL